MKRLSAISFAAGLVLLTASLLMGEPASTNSTAERNIPAPNKREASGPIVVITIAHVINPSSADFMIESIKRAEADGAQAIIVKLDTPGGLLDATRDIVQAMFASKAPVVIYIAPGGARAGSAGAFITYASHVAAMAPGTNIGAAHPVGGSGEDIQGDMREKVVNDAVAQVKSWAQERGRNVEWAEKAVRESASITDREAVEQKVVEISATDVADLVAKLDGREVKMNAGEVVVLRTKDAKIVEYEMSLKQRFVSTISQPNVAYVLLLIGLLGLFLEYVHPGSYVPGVIGGICVIMFFVIQSMPINYLGVALIILALVMLVAELYVTSMGLLAVGGIICFVLGSWLLFDTPDRSTVKVNVSVIAPTVILMVAAVLGVGYLALKTQLAKPVSGKEGLIGGYGEVRVALDPTGSVFFDGEFWNATSASPIPVGAKVKVLKIENMQLTVEAVDEPGALRSGYNNEGGSDGNV